MCASHGARHWARHGFPLDHSSRPSVVPAAIRGPVEGAWLFVQATHLSTARLAHGSRLQPWSQSRQRVTPVCVHVCPCVSLCCESPLGVFGLPRGKRAPGAPGAYCVAAAPRRALASRAWRASAARTGGRTWSCAGVAVAVSQPHAAPHSQRPASAHQRATLGSAALSHRTASH